MIYEILFFVGLFSMPAVLLILPIGLIELPYSFIKNTYKLKYRRLAHVCWFLSAIYIVAVFTWLSSLPGGSFSGLLLPPFLIIPGVLSIAYLCLLFKSRKPMFKCEICGEQTKINWGNASHVYCEKHKQYH